MEVEGNTQALVLLLSTQIDRDLLRCGAEASVTTR